MESTGAAELVRKSFTLKRRPKPPNKPQRRPDEPEQACCEACGHPGFAFECSKCGYEGDGLHDEDGHPTWPSTLEDLIQEAQKARRARRAAKRKKAARFRRNKRRAAQRAAQRAAKALSKK